MNMSDIQQQVGVFENQLVDVFTKAPHLPQNIRDILITLAPWLALIFGILGIVSLLALGWLWVLLTIVTLGASIWIVIHVLIGLASAGLALWAYSGLKEGLKSGWDKLFWSQIISAIGIIISIFGSTFSGWSLIGVLIGFYLLFEIRSHYK